MIDMGTKKGQVRKTARRAYIDPRKSATRKDKIEAAQRMRFLRKLGNGRKRAGEELFDSWMATLRDIVRRY
tara:strand:- start:2343 stop:2555 length:213 start_codon:yes stop_codon:yes gene_type:complete